MTTYTYEAANSECGNDTLAACAGLVCSGTDYSRSSAPQQYSLQSDSDVQTASEMKMDQFEALTRSFLSAGVPHKDRMRDWLIKDLESSRRVSVRVGLVLSQALRARMPSALDDAIDLLSNARVEINSYLIQVMRQYDLAELADDLHYVLLSSAARRPDEVTLPVLSTALESDDPKVRESAVYAIFDVGTDEARGILESVATADADAEVRELASELAIELVE